MKKILIFLIIAFTFWVSPAQHLEAAEADSLVLSADFEGISIDGVIVPYSSEIQEAIDSGMDLVVSAYANSDTLKLYVHVCWFDGSLYDLACYQSSHIYYLGGFVKNSYDFGIVPFDDDYPFLYKFYTYDLSSLEGSWSTQHRNLFKIYDVGYKPTTSASSAEKYAVGYGVLMSTVDVYLCSSNRYPVEGSDSYSVHGVKDMQIDNLFFRQTLVPKPTLKQAVKRTELAGVLMQVVRILPIAIPMVVCWLGLRKALKALRKVLFQA